MDVIIDKSKLDVLANSISIKSGEPIKLTLDEMKSAVDSIQPAILETASRAYSPADDAQTDTVTPGFGYNGLDSVDVTIEAISPYHVGSGIPLRSSSNVAITGRTVSVPWGYYDSQVTKSVASGTAGTPTATKGTVSNNSISITPSVTNTTGYITGGTKTGTAVSVSASELVSGTKTITQNGTGINVVNYANVDVNVSGGGNDFPTFTVTLNSAMTEILSVTCDKTFAECTTYLSNDVNLAKFIIMDGSSSTYTFAGNMSSTDSSKHIYEFLYNSYTNTNIAVQYNSDGTLSGTYDAPSVTTLTATLNGQYRDAQGRFYSSVDVNVTPLLQAKSKTYTPSESQQSETVTADSGYYGLSSVSVSVGAISSTYIGSGITQRSSSDLTVSGGTITAPAGYYSSSASKSVSSMTLPTSAASSATSGYTSKATISRSTSAQYINIPSGYNSAGAYYTISATPNGSVTAPSTISGTSATVSTGTNTLTLTKTVSVTPNVTTAGYISTGTAGNSSVSLTASVTTKAAATYHPSTSAQTISASQYLTGAQTIAAVTTTNLSASNILSGITIKVGDSSDDDCVASVTGNVSFAAYYTGSSAPSSSLGVNGDIYLKTS